MTLSETLYLFGDQTFDITPHLSQLLEARINNPTLSNFLDKSYDAIRLQIFRLPKHVRQDVPRFTNIEDVFHWKMSMQNNCCVPLDMAMTCIYQLGSFILR